MKILLADDERVLLHCLNDCVSAIFPNAELDLYEDGMAAWEMAQKKHYDLVITDLSMRRMNGDELAKRIYEKFPDTQILFVTGEPESTLKERGIPVERCVLKPYGVAEICEKTDHLEELPEFAIGHPKPKETDKENCTTEQPLTEKTRLWKKLFGKERRCK